MFEIDSSDMLHKARQNSAANAAAMRERVPLHRYPTRRQRLEGMLSRVAAGFLAKSELPVMGDSEDDSRAIESDWREVDKDLNDAGLNLRTSEEGEK